MQRYCNHEYVRANRSPKGNMWSVIPVALGRKQGSGPKGDSPVEHRGTFLRLSVHPPMPSQALNLPVQA